MEQLTGSKFGKEYDVLYCHAYLVLPCLFNQYAEYMWNAWPDKSPAGFKIAGRNIDNLRYSDDKTLMSISEEELKEPLDELKEESKNAGLKLNIQKSKIVASSPITSW